jgi:phage shock protein C
MTRSHDRSTDSLRRRRLYQNRENGLVFGICTGIANYFGFDVAITRILTALSLLFFTFPTSVAYLLLALLLPKKPRGLGHSDGRGTDELQRQVRSSPHETLESVRYRFRDLDARLQNLEKYLTSSRFKLDRELDSLKD